MYTCVHIYTYIYIYKCMHIHKGLSRAGLLAPARDSTSMGAAGFR